MSDLVEHILSENYVEAANVFEDRLDAILEQKLVEMKKCIQAEAAGGGMSKAEFDARRRLGWKPAKEVLPDPRDYVTKIKPKKPSVRKRKKIEEDHEADVQAAMAKLEKDKHPGLKAIHQYTPADITRRKHAQQQVHQLLPSAPVAPEKKKDKKDKKDKFWDKYKRPGMIKRNINTLMGRAPGHVDDRTEKEKEYEKGGKLGKAVRATGGAGKSATKMAIGAALRVANNLAAGG